MRVRRRRRRALVTVSALVYLGAFAWLVSPLWAPAEATTAKHVPTLQGPSTHPSAIAPLAAAKALPTSLPGSTALATTTEPEAGSAEQVSEAGAETTSVTSESSETQASPSPSTESSPSSQESSPSPQEFVSGEG